MTDRKPPHHRLTRPRDWFDLFFARGGWWVISCAVGLLLLTLFAMIYAGDANRYERDGIKSQARVVSKRVRTSDDSKTYNVRDGDSYWEGDVGPRPKRNSTIPDVKN